MSLASFAFWITGPPTQTGVPATRLLCGTLPCWSRTTVVATRFQVQVVPSAAWTTTDLPMSTDWITPRV